MLLSYIKNIMFCGKPKNKGNKPMGSPNQCLKKGIGIGLSLKKKAKPRKPVEAPKEKMPAMMLKADKLFKELDKKKKKESKKELLKKATKKAKKVIKRNNKITLRKYKE